jgi:sialic acid synthase SpsE
MLFVAEIGLNHDGHFALAQELIRQAAWAGADIAKFQFGWRDKPGEINGIDEERARTLRRWCDYWGVEMMASIITDEAFPLAIAADLPRYKIASRTVVDKPELCRRIIDAGRETFVSLGMWTSPGFPFGAPDGRVRYIYCRSSYPTDPQELADFPEQFGESAFYGYSDHCLGTSACLLAVARGAQYIEKHLTVNKGSQVIRDHVLSATPDEFRSLVDTGTAIARTLRAIAPVRV